VKQAHITVTPEAAVFDTKGQLVYHGAIDNWYVNIGVARPAPTKHFLEDALTAVLNGRKPEITSARAVGCFIADLQ
jgi:hypothetical protein